MSVDKHDGDLTGQARAMLEQPMTADEALAFLTEPKNFRTPANGIPEWFAKHHPDIKENKVNAAFVNKMQEMFGKDPAATRRWLRGEWLPDKDSAIKICFALGLGMEEANEFIFKVCKHNGFNFRRVEDVVACYALENKLQYAEVKAILEEYKKFTAEDDEPEFDDATKSTRHLETLFSDLRNMPRDEFIDLLCDNKHNFIGFSTSAGRLFKRLLDELEVRTKKSIEAYKNDQLTERFYKFFPRKGSVLQEEAFTPYHDQDVSVLSEIIFDEVIRSLVANGNARAGLADKPVLEDIIGNFPRDEYIAAMVTDAKTAAEAGYSRKTYILLFFANEVFKQEEALNNDAGKDRPKRSFYRNFYAKLDVDLLDCGFGLLHPANPFDWIILNCVRALDGETTEDLDGALQLFNDLLHAYIEA